MDASELMTAPAITISADATIEAAVRLMMNSIDPARSRARTRPDMRHTTMTPIAIHATRMGIVNSRSASRPWVIKIAPGAVSAPRSNARRDGFMIAIGSSAGFVSSIIDGCIAPAARQIKLRPPKMTATTLVLAAAPAWPSWRLMTISKRTAPAAPVARR